MIHYLDVLPRQFSTPMFWEEADLKELEGTDIVCKLELLSFNPKLY